MKIDGKTVVLGVIGDPVSHTFSPQIHRYFADVCGVNAVYVPFHVKSENIAAALSGAYAMGIGGLNITVPHKQAVMPYLSHIDPAAARVGSVNTLVRTDAGYAGYNTDFTGVMRTVTAQGLTFKNRPVTVLGAGGSAYAACVAAAEGGAEVINLANRSRERAAVLAAHVKKYYTIAINLYSLSDFPPAGEGSIVIQTTTLGFGPDVGRSPVEDPAFFKGAALAFDIVYTPWETAFIKQAKTAGIKTVNGFPMLVYQAAAAFVRWRDLFFTPDAEGALTDEDLSAQPHLDHLAREFQSRLHAD